MPRYVVIDFETTSALDLKKVGSSRYSEDPTTEIICLAYKEIGKEPVTWTPGASRALDLLVLVSDEEVEFIAHNAGFEKDIWRNIMVRDYGWPDIPNKRWQDTMAMCAMRQLPLDLERACLVLNLPYQKDMEGLRLTRAVSKVDKHGYLPKLEPVRKKIYAYNLGDVKATEALFVRLEQLPPGERQTYLLDQRINERGIRLDIEFIQAAQRVVDQATIPILKEFRELTGINPGQVAKFQSWLKAQNVHLPDLRKETIVDLSGLQEDDETEPEWDSLDLPENAKRALAIRQILGSASIKKLGRMLQVVCNDGRARRLLQYHAAGTGRWGGRLFQPQNFPRPIDMMAKVKMEDRVDAIMTGEIEIVAQFGPPIEVVVSSLRHTIISANERQFVSGDFAGIEARVCLALAGQHDKCNLMAAGADVYCDMAQAIYGHSVTKEEHPEKRQTGKNSVLGLGFQMWWPKFQARYAKKMPDEECEKIVRTYRDIWAPKVKYLWWGLEEAALKAVYTRVQREAYGVIYRLEDGWLTALLPSGRKLWYRAPRETIRRVEWSDKPQQTWSFTAMKNGRPVETQAFGGLLTENVVQGLARDLMCTAMFKCEKAGLPIVLTVHDEILCEPLKTYQHPYEILKQIMEDSPMWAKEIGIPVSIEGWVGGRYRK